jgi:hypothetical protein
VDFGGNSQKQQSSSTIAMQRPNLVAAKVDASGFSPAREVYSDGKTVFVYVPSAKQYMKQPAPPELRRARMWGCWAMRAMLMALAERRFRPAGQKPKSSFAARRPSRASRRELWRSTDTQGNSTLHGEALHRRTR